MKTQHPKLLGKFMFFQGLHQPKKELL